MLKVHACGICCTNLHMTSGHGELNEPANVVLGHEFAGEVVAVRKAVERIKIGDRGTALPQVGCGHCETCLKGEPKWCPDKILAMKALFKEARVSFAFLYGKKDFPVSIDALNSGAAEPRTMITERIGLDELPDMCEALRLRNMQCKVMINPWQA